MVGSIGVIGGGFDFTGLMDKLGIKRRLRTAGDNKGMGDPFSPETLEQQAIWQAMLKDIHSEFIQAVKKPAAAIACWISSIPTYSAAASIPAWKRKKLVW